MFNYFTSVVLLLGGCSSLVFAEKISDETASEIVAGGSADAGVQRVEDGSVISNGHTIKWRIFTDNGREFFLQVSTLHTYQINIHQIVLSIYRLYVLG